MKFELYNKQYLIDGSYYDKKIKLNREKDI